MLGIEDFKASNGWLVRFRDRHGITFKLVHGEEKSAPVSDANLWRENEKKKIMEKYAPDDIYNADETGMFYQLLPEKTLSLKGEKCSGGKKSKQRVTVLLCTNLTSSSLWLLGKA